MNKFSKGLLTACLTATFLGGLVACNQPSKELEGAAGYLYEVYKNDVKDTADYKLPVKVKYNEVFYPVTWTVNVTSGDANNIKVGTTEEKGFITVDVVYDPTINTADTVYTLTATITDEKGKTITQSFERTIPAFQFTTHAQYLAAKKDAMINVEGYIVGRYPLFNGTTQVFLQTANGEGYYVYKLPVEESKFESDMAIGNQIIVSGKKDIYSGTAEIVSPSYQLSSKADVTVEPYDITTLFDSASSISDATLVNLQGSLVTIKDVVLTTMNDSNGYLNFMKGNKTSYVRISSSGNCSDFDETAKDVLKGNYPSKQFYKADVTGIVNQYNGAFYLMPTSKDSIKVTGTAMEPAFALDYAVKTLEVAEEVFANLPTTVEGTGTTITWASTAEGVVATDGKVTPKSEPVTTTLTATVTLGDKSETKVFENVVIKLPDVSPIATVKAEMNKLGKDQTTDLFVIEGVIVAKDGSGRPYVMDTNGDVVLVYNNKDTNLKNAPVGTTVKLAGVGSVYNGLHQFGSSGSFTVLSVGTTTSEVVYGTPATIAAADFTKAVLTDKEAGMNGKYVRLTGVQLKKNGNYFNLYYTPTGGEEVQIQLQSSGMNETLAALDGKEVVVYGYSYGCNSTTARIAAVKVVDAADDKDPVVVPTGTTYTADYTGETTVNMKAEGDENATLLGLDATKWTVTATPQYSGNYTNYPGLNKDGGIRIYASDAGKDDASITFTLKEGTIKSVKITYKSGEGYNEGLVFTVGSTVVEEVNGEYVVNAASFTIANGKDKGQVRIDSIEIVVE